MARSKKAAEDPRVAQAFDASKHEDLAHYVEQLSPEQAQFFLTKLEAALKKRKLQLTGYLVAMVVWLFGMVGALAYFGIADGFAGWVFLLPFALVGGVLWLFGWLSNKAGAAAEVAQGDAGELSSRP